LKDKTVSARYLDEIFSEHRNIITTTWKETTTVDWYCFYLTTSTTFS